jgi:hypothetical protein
MPLSYRQNPFLLYCTQCTGERKKGDKKEEGRKNKDKKIKIECCVKREREKERNKERKNE